MATSVVAHSTVRLTSLSTPADAQLLFLQCFAFSPVGYVADLKDTVARILEGLESNVLERSAASRSLSSDYTRPDKQTAVMTFKSRFKT